MLSIAGFYEPFASLAHLFAAAFVLTRGVPLIAAGRGLAQRLGLGAFVLGALLLFAISGSYHLLDDGTAARAVMKRIDHAAIWVMIAGSFSSVHAIAFRGVWRWGVLAVVWAIAISGVVLKTVFFTALPEGAGLALYLAMGWLGLATIFQLRRATRGKVARLLVWSGVAYSAGAVYDYFEGPVWIPGIVGDHEVFHLAVIAGALLHWQLLRNLLRERGLVATDATRSRVVESAGGGEPVASLAGSPT